MIVWPFEVSIFSCLGNDGLSYLTEVWNDFSMNTFKNDLTSLMKVGIGKDLIASKVSFCLFNRLIPFSLIKMPR